jgi:hypothetical protein
MTFLINFVLTCARCIWRTLQLKSHLCIPFLEIAQPQSQFPDSCVCEQSINIIPRIQVHIFSCCRIGRSIEGLYKSTSQTDECGNWDCGCAIPFLGIFVSNFPYCVFALQWYHSIIPFYLFPYYTKFRSFHLPDSAFLGWKGDEHLRCEVFRLLLQLYILGPEIILSQRKRRRLTYRFS